MEVEAADVNNPDWLMKPDICPQTGRHLCRICGHLSKNFPTFKSHRNKKHGAIRNTITCPADRTKCARLSTMTALREHLLKEHGFKSVPEKLTFACRADFLKWKEETELATVACFVKHNTKGHHQRELYHCNRSGEERDHRKRKSVERQEDSSELSATVKKKKNRSKGTAKMGAHCPATISVQHDAYGQVNVEAYLTHFGHELDVRYLPVPKTTRERARTLLQSGNEVDQVLRVLKRESVPGDRTSLITPKMVAHRRRRDQERINEAHSNANYLLLQPELIVETRPNQEWLVQSSTDDKQYLVTRTQLNCPTHECHIRCFSCQICPHQYDCSCPRPEAYVNLPCMHTHGVHVQYGRRAIDSEPLDEQFDVELDDDEIVAVADEDEPTRPIAKDCSTMPKQPETNKKTIDTLQKLTDQEKRLLLKIEKWKDMWECLATDALSEASSLGDQLEEMLNEALLKAQIAPKISRPKVAPTIAASSNAQSDTTALPNTANTMPMMVAQKSGGTKRKLLSMDESRVLGKCLSAKKVRKGVTDISRPHRSTLADKKRDIAVASSSSSVIFDHTKFSLTEVDSSPEVASSQARAEAVAALTKKPPGDMLVLQYSRKPITNRLTSSGHHLRPIRQTIRCIACDRVIGANNLTARKCVKCSQWCHHICSHLCFD